MTAASEVLFMSQSAVSQAIAEMEKHYETRLFERYSKRLFLTKAGEKLLSYARHMIRMNQEAEQEIRALNRSGYLRIGASVTVGGYVLPKLVAAFQQQNPQAEIEVCENNTEKVEGLILRDKIDIGLVEGEITSPEILQYNFMDDELVLVCGKSHRFAGYKSIEPIELEKENFIIREQGSGTRKTFEDVMTANQISWKETWVCNNSDTIKSAVGEGLGVTVISKRSVEAETAAGSLRSIPINGIRFLRTFKIIYHKNKFMSDTMKSFIALCNQFIA